MPALKNAVRGFQTGDLIITYLPRGGTRPMHVTIYLEPKDSPSNDHAFIHAANDGIVIEDINAWKEMPKYRHAHRVGELAKAAADAAKVWAADRTINNNTPITTPYGSYPGSKQSATPQLRANRFSAMMQTASIAAIPLEAAGLVRLMKWTYRLHTRAPLSANRGITCAAFSCACHQAAAMKIFLRDQGALDKLNTANLGKINGLLESKGDLRARLNLPEAHPLPEVVTAKPILIGAALRENSNRGMTEKTQEALGNMVNTATEKPQKMLEFYPEFFPNQASLATASATDFLWLAIQTKVLGISTYSARRLSGVIPPDFFYDAKYVNSILLDELIRNSVDWNTTDYDAYD
ncbi:hypothetical protein [Methylomicrobium sp. Wu6]|uniref:hypothetical protein n=1 Tax=Methylomicrobium sp. Wu6 TaxID=3107928 RepID=UPI002DD68CAC|nr:hypothetical protein [Methylomicrobium sp. Wu6]MEC4747256.1 hypothetical protein [Methylomicrobium sp. Wu6]